MTIAGLAKQLRRRLVNKGLVLMETASTVPDFDVVGSYNTCSCCGRKFLPSDQFAALVCEATGDESFLSLCDAHMDKTHPSA